MRAALGILLIGLASLLLVQWWDWPPPPNWRASSAPANGQGEAVPLDVLDETIALDELRDREAYNEIIERPLFLPDRRPPDPDEDEEDQAPLDAEAVSIETLDLLAIIITPQLAKAWVRQGQATDHTEVRQGEEIAGWTVAEIRGDRLILERQDETGTLELRSYEAQPTSPQRTARQGPFSRPGPPKPPRPQPKRP